MPTVHRERGFKFRIYPDDHGHPHVHVWKAGRTAKVLIGDEYTPAKPLDPGRMATVDVRRAVRMVEANWRTFLQDWRTYND